MTLKELMDPGPEPLLVAGTSTLRTAIAAKRLWQATGRLRPRHDVRPSPDVAQRKSCDRLREVGMAPTPIMDDARLLGAEALGNLAGAH